MQDWLARREESISLSVDLTLCDPIHCSQPGFSVHRILQARIWDWVAMPFSRHPPDPGIQPRSPALQADSLPSEPPGKLPSMVSCGKRASAPDLPGQWTLRFRKEFWYSGSGHVQVTFQSVGFVERKKLWFRILEINVFFSEHAWAMWFARLFWDLYKTIGILL